MPSARLAVALANLGFGERGTPGRKSTVPLRQKKGEIEEVSLLSRTTPRPQFTYSLTTPLHLRPCSRPPLWAQAFSQSPFNTATFVALAPFHALHDTGAVEKELILQAAAACQRAPHVRKYASQLRESLFGPSSGPLLAVHIRREASDLGCESGRRFVVCPIPGQTVTTEEIAQRYALACEHAIRTKV